MHAQVCVPGADKAPASTTRREPFKMNLDFSPKDNVAYKSRFRFHVSSGAAVDILVSGEGSLEENYDSVF